MLRFAYQLEERRRFVTQRQMPLRYWPARHFP